VKAVSITDVIEDGLSMVYSFYEPNFPQLSLGKFMILDHISLTKEMNLPYLYLGYWVKGSKKMNYKAQYKPLEIFLNGKWSLLEDKIISKQNNEAPPSTTDPVLNTIYLPDGDQ
jgi:arginine-tRNA-protein transferase